MELNHVWGLFTISLLVYRVSTEAVCVHRVYICVHKHVYSLVCKVRPRVRRYVNIWNVVSVRGVRVGVYLHPCVFVIHGGMQF